jgi:hypothetical protein
VNSLEYIFQSKLNKTLEYNEKGKYVDLTSLLFHPQAFTAQCATTWIQTSKGQDQ